MMPPDPAATTLAATVLRAHFGEAALQRVVSTRREFPQHLKLDVVESIRTQLAPFPVTPLGIHQKYPFMAITFAGLSVLSQDPERLAPVQYQDVDIGDDRPVPCLAQGLWLFAVEGAPVAVLFSQNVDPGRVPVVNVEIAYLDERTIPFVEVFLTRVAADSAQSARYRGKILSLDGSQLYSGLAAPLKVHRLSRRERSSMILPESVMERIDEQIFGFEAQKAILKKYGQSLRKGVLLYGPPGNGKTHLINYIISNLPDRTAILLLGTDVGQLMRYMELARTLQPALIVIEDVDVIGRSRDQITHPAMEATLNRLLNEMDGLGDDADILFILTTNRPEELEEALALRPGRIDEAIEVPPPDHEGRARLIQLYGAALNLEDAVVQLLAARSDGVSAAFMKELVRRLVLAGAKLDGGINVDAQTARGVIERMLSARGSLPQRILGVPA